MPLLASSLHIRMFSPTVTNFAAEYSARPRNDQMCSTSCRAESIWARKTDSIVPPSPLTPTPRRSGAGSTLYLHGKTRMQNSFFVLNTYHNCYTSSKRSLDIENLTSGIIFFPFPIIYSIHACPPFRYSSAPTTGPQVEVGRICLTVLPSVCEPLYLYKSYEMSVR